MHNRVRTDFFQIATMKTHLQKLLGVLLVVLPIAATRSGTVYYPYAAENPIVDGAFSTSLEYATAVRELDDLGLGYYYKQNVWNWTVNSVSYPGVTFFNNHYFRDPAYSSLDTYDLNSFEVRYGNHVVTTWVFLSGDEASDSGWLDIVGIGSANYPTGLNDDGGFLVRLDNDPLTDRIWRPGDSKPGDPGWDFADYYGIFAQGGFNDSAFQKGYDTVNSSQEIYEWSITLNQVGSPGLDGGLPGVPLDPGNPLAPDEFCVPLWDEVVKYKEVCDWTPKMGGYGTWGGIGWVPDGTEWVIMGYDASMHPVPEPSSCFLLFCVSGCFLLRRTLTRSRRG